jgi:hypothetical protein
MGLKIEEGDRAMVDFLPDNAGRGKLQPIAIESHGALQIVDAQGQHGDVRFHGAATQNVILTDAALRLASP